MNAHGKLPFADPALPLQDRTRDLISRLTLEEKIGFIPTRNAAVERLGIAAWSIGAEGAHGFVNRDGHNTTFPQTIGLAASWDRELLRKIGEVVATEARVYYKTHNRKGGLSLWSPTIDMERHPLWGRTEEGYGEDPFLVGELSSCYIQGAQGDDPFYLRVSCGPKHFFANNNEKNRYDCSCSIPPRCMHEYYLVPFKTAVQKAKAVSIMTAYNEVNGIPMMLHPMLNDIVKNEWGMDGHFVTDGGDFIQTVNLHHYFETHAETLAAALKNGADSMTDDEADIVVSSAREALEKKLLDETELDKHLERIFSVRFRLGHFDPPGLCPYDAIDETYLMRDEYVRLAQEAVGKSAVLLKNEGRMLPLRPDTTKGTIAVIGPLANAVHMDWYTGIPTYLCTPLEGLRDMFDKDKILYTDCRDIVSFATDDGRPLVLADDGNPERRLLSVGTKSQSPARFYREDWGWGSQTFTDVETGLLLEGTYWRKQPGESDDHGQNRIRAGGKSTLSWFAFSVFNPIPQADGLVLLRTYDNRRLVAPSEPEHGTAVPVFMRDDPVCGPGELFRMTLEREGISLAVEAAAKADHVIFVGGNNPMINGRECTDRPSLNLPPCQEECIHRVFAANPKMALVLISGYPFTCKVVAEKIPAILWMAPGIQETGRGFADIIGGNRSPAGRLPLTWYEDEGQLPPIMEYDIISAGITYQYFRGNVLWPFGYGLSYSSFAYSELAVSKTVAGDGETVTVSFKTKNTGSVVADEVPQLYITVTGSVFRRPLQILKGFDRISMAPGEERIVRFDLPVSELAVWDNYRGHFCVEKGYCKILVGTSSQDIRLTGGFEVLGENLFPRKISGPIHAERFDDYSCCFLHEKRGSAIPAVFNKEDGGWIRFSALDFSASSGSSGRFSAVVQGKPGSRIELRLGAPDGRLAGTIDVPNTGPTCAFDLVSSTSPRRLPGWACAEGPIEKICGIHDLYMILYGETGLWLFDFM